MNNVSTKSAASNRKNGMLKLLAQAPAMPTVDPKVELGSLFEHSKVLMMDLAAIRKSVMEMWAASSVEERDACLGDLTRTLYDADEEAEEVTNGLLKLVQR